MVVATVERPYGAESIVSMSTTSSLRTTLAYQASNVYDYLRMSDEYH
jgi:hypothetical protein